MDNDELQKQLAKQSKLIAELTATVGRFLNDGLAFSQRNMVYCGTQNDKGGAEKSQIAKNFNSTKQEELEFMQTQKNVRKRKDGRYEWQKMIAGIWHREIDKDYKELKRKIAEHERELKQILKHTRFLSRIKRERPILFELCKANIKANRKDADCLNGLQKKHLSQLTKPIDQYTKADILIFLKELPIQPLTAYQVLKSTFAEAAEDGTLDRNPIATLKCPYYEKTKGRWFTPAEQIKIHENKANSGMADEIDFYLMTGCRANEAPRCVPHFDKCLIWVERSKIDGTSGYVKISQEYCDELRQKWATMFQKGNGTKYGTIFREFLKSIDLKQKDTCLHSLRHTFCSNLYYLGAPDKFRQHAMGHKDSRMTSDRYTTYDPNITKQDILDIYQNTNLVYPNFENTRQAA